MAQGGDRGPLPDIVRVEFPGVLVDVIELLRGLGPAELFAAVSAAVDELPEVRKELTFRWTGVTPPDNVAENSMGDGPEAEVEASEADEVESLDETEGGEEEVNEGSPEDAPVEDAAEQEERSAESMGSGYSHQGLVNNGESSIDMNRPWQTPGRPWATERRSQTGPQPQAGPHNRRPGPPPPARSRSRASAQGGTKKPVMPPPPPPPPPSRPSSGSNMNLGQREPRESFSDPPLRSWDRSQRVLPPPTASSKASMALASSNAEDICRDHQNGRCNRGNACRFRHMPPEVQRHAATGAPKDFNPQVKRHAATGPLRPSSAPGPPPPPKPPGIHF